MEELTYDGTLTTLITLFATAHVFIEEACTPDAFWIGFIAGFV